MKRAAALIILAALASIGRAAEVDAQAVTNLIIESGETNVLGWTRQAVLGSKEGGIVDRSGTVVAYADVEAQRVASKKIKTIGDAAYNGMTNAVAALWSITNQIPASAEHIALYLPRDRAAVNLVGEVVEEGTDGVTDWQIVKYSQLLSIPPTRHIVYGFLGETATVSVVWDTPWDTSNTLHRCTFTRPALFRGKVILSRFHETIGGDVGFDFGSALVTLDGEATFTGVWTNSLDGTIHTFKNGAKIENVNTTTTE